MILFVLLKEGPVKIQISIFQTRIPFFTENYLVDGFLEYSDASK